MTILNHPAESNPLDKRDYKSIHVDTEVIEGNGSVGSIFESPADDNACDGYDEKTSNQRRKQGVKVLLFAASAICMTIIGISNLHSGSNLINPPQRDLDGGFFFGTWSTTDGNSEDSADTNRKDESKSGDGGDDSESETPFVPPNVPDESDPHKMARFEKEINSRSDIPDYVPIWRDNCCDNRMFLIEGKKCQDACVSLCPDLSRRTMPVCYSDCNAKCGRHASQFKDFRNSNKVV